MKRICFILLLTSFIFENVFAQYEPPYQANSRTESIRSYQERPLKAFYLGPGTAMYGKYGLIGINFSARIAPKTIGEMHLGVGGWGTKAGFSFTTNVTNKRSWCPTIGFGRSFGGMLNSEVNVTYNGVSGKITTDVVYQPFNVIHLGVQKQYVNSKGNRFVIELGYSLGISETKVEFANNTVDIGGVTVPSSDLTFTSDQKDIFRISNPAGIMVGLSYQFGMGEWN